ncbi:P-loop containing nucleoside triphosphate hydrolase protein [Sphaerosporella brunnea]|uniref:P-loop containing nucleoside triphosphate hydrolase protein n=1 Tax=Sphaerosporella brunnea TaxID=1250544 RepID=A0A5J5EDG7_9PEZI|nr:P-loop containing nucleoside triphosphate hydrolase protein [Sphaerosporella brunnea]
MSPRTTFIVGISGLSSSGKTTLSRLLRGIFPSAFILHQDDFYLADSLIPVTASGAQDWDCAESIDWAAMSRALAWIRASGSLPLDLKSLQDASPVGNGEDLVGEEVVRRMREKVEMAAAAVGGVSVAILDGFLMLHEGSPVEAAMDSKLLLRVPYQVAKQRRESRTGYVTIEGFWQDPPGYFDTIVWPNYVKEHRYLFVDEDVEGQLKPEIEAQRRVHTPQRLDDSIEKTLEWAVDILIDELKSSQQKSQIERERNKKNSI